MNQDKSPNWNLYGDDESEDSDTSTVKKRQPDFFGAFMADRLAQAEKSASDDEEETTEEGKKVRRKKKFTGLFNEIFPQIVEPQKPSPKPESQGESSAVEAENTQADYSVTESIPPDTGQLQDVPAVRDLDETLPSQSVSNEEVAESTDLSTEVESEPSDLHEAETVSISESSEIDEPNARDQDIYNESNPPVEDHRSDAVPSPQSVAEQHYTQNVMPTGSTTVAPEALPRSEASTTVVERRPVGAILAFLGAEFLSRRRDRKLAANINKQKKSSQEDIQRINQNQLSQAQAQEQLKEHQKKQGEELAAIQAKSMSQERPHTQRNSYIPRQNAELYAQSTSAVSETAQNTPDVRTENYRSNPENISLPPVFSEQQSYKRFEATTDKSGNESPDPRSKFEKLPDIDESSPESLSHIINKRQYQNRARTFQGYASLQNNDELSLSRPETISGNSIGTTQAPQSQIDQPHVSYKQPIQIGVASAVLIIIAFIIVYFAIY